MTEATKTPISEPEAFSRGWILPDGARAAQQPQPTIVTEQAVQVPAQTASTPSKAPKQGPGLMSRAGSWIARSIMLLVFIAALVACGMAVTSLYHTTNELSAAERSLEQAQGASAATSADLATARDSSLELQQGINEVTAERDAAVRASDELKLEIDVLRGMLLDAEQPVAPEA